MTEGAGHRAAITLELGHYSLDRGRLADLAFAAASFDDNENSAETQRVAMLPADALDLDLSDPEQRRFGDYELIAKLGQGGMGVVYRARQISLNREVALKLLSAGPWAGDDFIERFRQEAQSAAAMHHPHIMNIHEIGSQDGLHYFSMDLVRGPGLNQIIIEKGRLPAEKLARWGRIIAEAVEYAHSIGVLHLDLKPANVMIDQGDRPVVADFGLARRLDYLLTGDTGEVCGSPSYMAPEQALGENSKLSVSTDIYGLGAILYEMLTGAPPFLGPNAEETMRRVVEEPLVKPREIDPRLSRDLEAICLTCLAKNPLKRYLSARAVADDLGRVLEGREISVRPLSTWAKAGLWIKRAPLAAAALILSFTVLLAGLIVVSLFWREAEHQRASAEAERVRLQRAFGMLAASVPENRGDHSQPQGGLDRSLDWLQHESGTDAAGQLSLILDMTRGLDRQGKNEEGYRIFRAAFQRAAGKDLAAAAEQLASRRDARSRLSAALIALPVVDDADALAKSTQYFQLAAELADSDPVVWSLLLEYCRGAGCPIDQARKQLLDLDPGNSASWLLSVDADASQEQLRAALAQAAKARRYDEYAREWVQLLQSGYQNLAVPGATPDQLKQLHRALLLADFSQKARHPDAQSFDTLCRDGSAHAADASLIEDCRQVAARMIVGGSWAARERALRLAHHLALNTDDEPKWFEQRRRERWLLDAEPSRGLTADEVDVYLGERISLGEVAADIAALNRRGIAPVPPAGWLPREVGDLISP